MAQPREHGDYWATVDRALYRHRITGESVYVVAYDPGLEPELPQPHYAAFGEELTKAIVSKGHGRVLLGIGD